MKESKKHVLSDQVNNALSAALAEDQEDLAPFADREAEPIISYEALLDDLKLRGKPSQAPTDSD